MSYDLYDYFYDIMTNVPEKDENGNPSYNLDAFLNNIEANSYDYRAEQLAWNILHRKHKNLQDKISGIISHDDEFENTFVMAWNNISQLTLGFLPANYILTRRDSCHDER
jgi:uncharacterized protein (DUF608 family)